MLSILILKFRIFQRTKKIHKNCDAMVGNQRQSISKLNYERQPIKPQVPELTRTYLSLNVMKFFANHIEIKIYIIVTQKHACVAFQPTR
jgi:hypothetical protein